jgi:hypothetical protein
MEEKIIFPRKEYLKRQIEIALGPYNMWLTGEEVHHPPNEQEALLHFAKFGGSEEFAEHLEDETT